MILGIGNLKLLVAAPLMPLTLSQQAYYELLQETAVASSLDEQAKFEGKCRYSCLITFTRENLRCLCYVAGTPMECLKISKRMRDSFFICQE